ncbi:DinB family protein [Salinibacillus xinjiangensis]|uniref:DinB-like domain-containing protein n=1 Tax=Salinibacillus xinjiangensis TaxID=1229268 RepID=A0A6G1X491_9BACI|nr:DinB family protein [Salinibacillus xinjiangensis]MRG85700.1 hypothetical protein [Salinibacillus xinjiangensis]
MDDKLFQHFHFVRGQTLAALDGTTEEIADMIPTGFHNNIRWNLGHIFLSLNNLLYSYIGEKHGLTERDYQLFQFSTSPSD